MRGGGSNKQGKKDDPSGGNGNGKGKGKGKKSTAAAAAGTGASSAAKSAASASMGGGNPASDVYGDLFNLGPSTFGDEAAMTGMSNHMLYFGEDPMPPTSSWDIPSISGQENLAMPSVRCPTPVSNFGAGPGAASAADVSPGGPRQGDTVGGLPGANPYDPYYMAQHQHQQHQQAAMYAAAASGHHVNHPGVSIRGGPPPPHASHPDYGPMGGYGAPTSGPPGTSAYAVDSGAYGIYGGGGQHLQHHHAHHQPHYMSGMQPQHPHDGRRMSAAAQAQAAAAAVAQHRSMSHYSAGAHLPVNMSSNALSNSGAVAAGSAGGKMRGGRYGVDQAASGNVSVGNQGNGSGSKTSKKKTSNKRKGGANANLDAGPPPAAAGGGGSGGGGGGGGGYMQPTYHMHGPPQSGGPYGYGPPAPYSHQPVGSGNPYSHPHSQGMGQKMRQTAAAAAGVMQPATNSIGEAHHSRKQFPIGVPNNPSGQDQQQEMLSNSASQLGDEQLAYYVRQMLSQLQQVISMLDVNTKKTISDSLLRLASTKQQISGSSGSAAQQHQSHQNRQIDRSICQLLYNNHTRDYPTNA